jgi:hypothetical protein
MPNVHLSAYSSLLFALPFTLPEKREIIRQQTCYNTHAYYTARKDVNVYCIASVKGPGLRDRFQNFEKIESFWPK